MKLILGSYSDIETVGTSPADFIIIETEDEGFSNFFLQDLKSLGAAAENVLKKVQDMMDDKSMPRSFL